eukprot:2174326-Alexandrium_andersonii.AAC.1
MVMLANCCYHHHHVRVAPKLATVASTQLTIAWTCGLQRRSIRPSRFAAGPDAALSGRVSLLAALSGRLSLLAAFRSTGA